MDKRFRAVPPLNVSPEDAGPTDWAVYDSVLAKVGKRIYTRSFAETLATNMNWAYEQGRKSR